MAQGAVNYGSFAMNVMRMEKMFKGAGELTNEGHFAGGGCDALCEDG